jgi:hypothetical protein
MVIKANKPRAKRTIRVESRATTNGKSKKGPAEKRSSERANMIVTASASPNRRSPDHPAHKIWLTNISLGGVGFQSGRRYARGSSCFIRLDVGPIRFDNAGQVVWCRKRAKNVYDVGCELLPD